MSLQETDPGHQGSTGPVSFTISWDISSNQISYFCLGVSLGKQNGKIYIFFYAEIVIQSIWIENSAVTVLPLDDALAFSVRQNQAWITVYCHHKSGQKVTSTSITTASFANRDFFFLSNIGRPRCQKGEVKNTQFSSVQSLSHVQLFTTAPRQACLSITSFQSLLKLMFIELVMPSNHHILCHPLLLLPSIFPASGSFQMSQFFASGAQSIGVSASTSVLPMNTQDWFPSGRTGWISLQSKRLSRVFSNTTVPKHQFFSAQFSL